MFERTRDFSCALVIEDDTDIVELLRMHLVDVGLSVESVQDGNKGLQMALDNDYALLIVDWNLPELSGIELCRRFRKINKHRPIIMLTSRTDEIDRIMGLEAGVDDFVSKPFSVRELNARIRALLRRSNLTSLEPNQIYENQSPIQKFESLCIDRDKRKVTVNEKLIELTAREFELLAFLSSKPGRPYTREQMLERVWGYDSSGYERVVTTYIARLRIKIEEDPQNPRFILTVRGVGYKFADNVV